MVQFNTKNVKYLELVNFKCNQGFWIYLYFRIRHSFAYLRPVILSADWSVRRLQSWDLFKSADCRWISKTYAEYCYRNSATVCRLVQSPTLKSTIIFCGCPSDLRGKGIRVSPAWCNPIVLSLKCSFGCCCFLNRQRKSFILLTETSIH